MKEKILVVDNHPVILKLMSNLLEKSGHEVLTAGDGLSALDILKSFSPDVIFIDWLMPNISGEKLCRIIRGMPQFKETFIVILSAIAAEEEHDFGAYGADACIAKGPFKDIAANVSALMKGKGQKVSGKDYTKEIIGYESLYEREVTQELLSLKRHFENILAEISEGILELTTDGRVIYANPMAVELIGKPEEKILSRRFADFFAGKDRKRVQHIMPRSKSKAALIEEDKPVSLRDRQFTLTLLPVQDQDAKSIIVIILDITERRKVGKELTKYRKHLEDLVQERTAKLLERTKELQEEIAERRLAEEERRKLQIQLQQTQKMEAIGTLAGGIAHDFNNILSAILGYAELSIVQTPKESKPHDYMKKIVKSVERAADLVRQILTFSRQTDQELKPMYLQPVIKETLKLMRGSLPSTIEIEHDIDPDCRPILANFTQIHQVLMNLCANAYHAMRKTGGVLTVSLSEGDLLDKLLDMQPGLRPGKYAKLTCADTGCGMDEATRERVFEPYFTTKKHGEGTGLGLATAHGVVLSHEGAICVESEPQKGAVFEVYFPILEGTVVVEKKAEREMSLHPKAVNVLFVDDEEMIVELAKSILERMNCNVVALTDSIEALTVFEEDPDKFDIVITDQTMPGMTGVDLSEKILAIRPQIPIILSTGFSENVDEAKAKEIGIKEFIMKPLAIRDLSQIIWKIMDKKEKRDSLVD